MADSVLTGDQTTKICCLAIDVFHEDFDVFLEGLFVDCIIAACVDVKVSVACVAKALDLEAVSVLCGFYIGQVLSNLGYRDNDVALIQPCGLCLDGLEEGGTSCPCVALLGAWGKCFFR